MSCFAIRAFTRLSRQQRPNSASARSLPNSVSSSDAVQRRPGISCPPLRPDAPKPICSRSIRITEKPRSAQASAALSPVKPPPIKATSHWGSPSNERSEEHTSELQSLMRKSYADICVKKKKLTTEQTYH